MPRAEEFPPTEASAIIALRSPDASDRERSFERVVSAYYRPVYMLVRVKFRCAPDEAQDVTHDFFLRAAERETFASYDPTLGRFRTFVRACVENFVLSRIESANRVKRGGRLRFVTFDPAEVERDLAGNLSPPDPETIFEREWARGIATRAVSVVEQRLAGLGKSRYFEVLRRYDLHEGATEPTYASIAAEMGIKPTDVTNYLHAARRELRAVVLDILRDLTASEDELRAEARELLGIEILMFDDATVACPYCGEACSLTVERDVEGSFIQDCEVCCRPWAVSVTRDEDGEVSVRVERSD